MEVMHSGKKGAKFDNIGKIFVYRKTEKGNQRMIEILSLILKFLK
jgi:hypothetical protein